jgi:serine/threonine-protein kinase
VLKVLVDVLGGLHYAHELRDFDGTHLDVVHRDVSPQNIFVTYDGNTKLVDFGVAKAACSDMETRAGVIKGKIAYLSPEQAGADPVDRRADIFSVGVLLWEALARKRFSSGAIDVATIHKRVTGGEPRIREVVPDVPTDLADICDKAIALRPDDRFATALEMKEALETVLESRRERAKTHSLAVLVTEAFAEERSTIKTVIEEHAKVAYSEPPGKTGSNPIPVLSPQPGDASNPTGSLPSATSIGGASVVTGDIRPPKASVMPWLAVVAVVGIAGATIAYVVSQGDSATPTAASSQPLATSAAQPPEVTKVELIVIASPPEAVITLDGTQLSSNPFRAQVERGSQMHKILAKAEGYTEQEKVVVFDQNLTVKLTLERTESADKVAPAKPTAGGTRAAAATPGTPVTATATTPPAGATAGDRLRTNRDTGKPTRTIDDKDPYAQ